MTKTSQHSILGVWSSQILIQHSLNKGIVVQLTAYMIFPLILFLSSVHQRQPEVLDMAVFLWRSLICSVWLWQWSSDQVLTLYCVQLKQICSIILTAVPSQHSQQSTERRPNRVKSVSSEIWPKEISALFTFWDRQKHNSCVTFKIYIYII